MKNETFYFSYQGSIFQKIFMAITLKIKQPYRYFWRSWLDEREIWPSITTLYPDISRHPEKEMHLSTTRYPRRRKWSEARNSEYKNSVKYSQLTEKMHKKYYTNKVQFIIYKGMEDTKNIKHSRKGMELLSMLSEAGKKIFNTSEAKEFAISVGIPSEYVSKVLHLLKRGGWIISLKSGLFALSKGFSTEPLHEFEIAMALTKPVAISHWSALHYHGLSDQIPRKVFLLMTQEATVPRQRQGVFGTYTVNEITFVFSRIKKELFFGITRIWINRSEISITDPERTLLDGLDKPQLCGGFNEVLHAFQVFKSRIDLEKIISYALQWDTAIVKRLGWVLSYLGFEKKRLTKLQKVKVKGYRRLDCSVSGKGRCNSTWMIQENIYE